VSDKLSPEDIRRLQWLLACIERIEGWCLINRWIGKTILVGGIGMLIWFSNILDAFKNLLGLKH
jgi:hypothetical protein